jgi:glycosyltransferase involved in cell wall biosynthesis
MSWQEWPEADECIVKIGVYIEHGVGDGVGGAELKMVRLASYWSRHHDVELIHHRPTLTLERLATFTDDDLQQVRIRLLPRDPEPRASGGPLRRYQAARNWHRRVSEGYDLFVNCTHWKPCFCHARCGALVIPFPFSTPSTDVETIRPLTWKQRCHRLYYDWEWRQRLSTYTHFVANSEYTRMWTQKRWGVACDVVHPPVDVNMPVARKEPLILSVGRFSSTPPSKKQLEMLRAFQTFRTTCREWKYACVGGLNSREENREYFEQVRNAAVGHAALVEANISRQALKDLFARARIYWHAAGLNDDPQAHPELAEHFGISTVEAMAAGCVPVVINKGGQPEIVQHRVNGFVWNTVDELVEYTRQLAADAGLCDRMSAAARLRAQEFGSSRFFERMSLKCGVSVDPEAERRSAVRAFAAMTGAISGKGKSVDLS